MLQQPGPSARDVRRCADAALRHGESRSPALLPGFCSP